MWQILITSLLAGIIAQLIKPLLKFNRLKFGWRSFFSYSGMPSSHAAFVVSLTTIVGLSQKFNSPLFAVCFIFSALIIRDALGLRQYLGQHNRIINTLLKDLKTENKITQAYPELVEKIGHTPAQIIAGSLLGFLIGLAGYFVL